MRLTRRPATPASAFVLLALLLTPAVCVADDAGSAASGAVPDWIVQPLGRKNAINLLGRGMQDNRREPDGGMRASEAADNARKDLETVVKAISQALAMVMLAHMQRPPHLPDPDHEEPLSPPEQLAADMNQWCVRNYHVLATHEVVDPETDERIMFALAGVELEPMLAEIERLADAADPDRPALPTSAILLGQMLWMESALQLHGPWLERLPQWVRERPVVRSDVLQKKRVDKLGEDTTIGRFIRVMSEYSLGPTFEYAQAGLAGIARLGLHTQPEPWKTGATLQAQLTAGLRIPLIAEKLDAFAMLQATIANNTADPSFDGFIVGLRLGFLSPTSKMLSADDDRPSTPLAIDVFGTFPFGTERDLSLNDIDGAFDVRASVSGPLRLMLDLGGGFGFTAFFRIALRLEVAAISIALSDELGLLLIVPGIDMEWRLAKRNLDRYELWLGFETKGLMIQFRLKFSGELGRQFSTLIGWRF
ncbi:MAG: hypothetical protein AB7K09_18955 [Planctomycetota bacterium]